MRSIADRLRSTTEEMGLRASVGVSLCFDAADEIDRLSAENARLRGALRFYADPWQYTDCNGDDVRVPDFYSELDFGETARAALAEKEEK